MLKQALARSIAGMKLLLRLHTPGRNLIILPDDVFLVSFPKSGNTWARFLVANLVHPEQPANFRNIHQLVPDPEGTAKKYFDRAPRPRVIKSHECFEPRFPRVIYIIRDPRDVALSQYHYHRKRLKIDDHYSIEKFVTRFIAGETCAHGSWGENVLTWLITRRNDPRFLLLRYEDMVADTPRELGKIAAFLGIAPSAAQILQAVERSSADQMRKLEEAQSHLCTLTDTRPDIPFVRAAKSGDWRSGLPPAAVEKIEAAWGALMRYLQYDLISPCGSESPGADFLEPVLNGTRH
jgi:Sulfotransferase domain